MRAAPCATAPSFSRYPTNPAPRARARRFRLFRMSSFGLLIHGTTSHWFYGMLDGKIPGKDAKAVFSKVFIDQVLWNPCFGVMFFSYVALLEAKGLQYVVDKTRNELLTQARVAASHALHTHTPLFLPASLAPPTAPCPRLCVHLAAGDGILEGVAAGAHDQLQVRAAVAARAVHQQHPDRLQLLPVDHRQPREGGEGGVS